MCGRPGPDKLTAAGLRPTVQERYVELRHLRYFTAVADELSFTRASRALHVAQSAVSAQVHDLEQQIGVALFDRNSRRVRLTPAGKAFRESALRILQAVDDAVRQARRIGQASYGTLAVGFSGAQSHELMPQILRRFRQTYPAIEVTLLEMVPLFFLHARTRPVFEPGLRVFFKPVVLHPGSFRRLTGCGRRFNTWPPALGCPSFPSTSAGCRHRGWFFYRCSEPA